MNRRRWTPDKLAVLGRTINKDGLGYDEAAKRTGLTVKACRRQYLRTDWENLDNNAIPPRPWRVEDLVALYTLREEAHLGYKAIGAKLNRAPAQCETKFQHTDWEPILAHRSAVGGGASEINPADADKIKEENINQLAMYLVELSRYSLQRLEAMTQDHFLEKANMGRDDLPIGFDSLKEAACKRMNSMGLGYAETKDFGEGTYLVFGDSHGKHTPTKLFALVKQLNSFFKPKAIIHIGHALDDDNDISFIWQDFSNLTILAKREELATLAKVNERLKEKGKKEYDICRGSIQVGDMTVANQDMITDYVLTPIGTIKRQLFPDSVIVNLHRHEFDSRTVSNGHSVIMSPGCLCENHIAKVIKQMDFTDGLQVKMAYPDGFIKYRRMRHMYNFWEQGFIVVHVDKQGNSFPVQCRIRQTSRGFTTSYCGKIIAEDGAHKPDQKIAFNSDVHCRLHDPEVLDVQGQFCADYRPDVFVNLGDLMRNQAMNHHLMAKNGAHMDVKTSRLGLKFLDETAHAHWLLKKMRPWGKKYKLTYGNHERFAKDLADRFPQLAEILDFGFTTDLASLGVELTPLKGVLNMGPLRFIHGDFMMFGAKGPRMDKISHTFSQNTVVGHLHYPCVRLGCYMVGMSGLFDQEYNEPLASAWMHGMGCADIFDGKAFISLIHIRDHRTMIGGKIYSPKSPGDWDLPAYNASLSYSFE